MATGQGYDTSQLGAGGWGNLIATGITAYGAAQTARINAKAQKANLEYQRHIAIRNARLAEMRAADVKAVGHEQLFRMRLGQSQQIGAERAFRSAMGGDIREGSHARILRDVGWAHDLDAKTLLSNVDKEVWVMRNKALGHMMNAEMLSAMHDVIKPSKEAGAAAAGVLSGVSQQWYRYAKTPLQPDSDSGAKYGFGRNSQDSHGAEYE